MELTKDQLHTLRHMLGINTPHDRVPDPYRNYAAVVPGDPKFIELERLGVVKNCGRPAFSEYDHYRCTPAGQLAAIESHKEIRRPKPKRRYAAYLALCDCCPDLTFQQFLTAPEFKEVRENA